MKMKEVVISGGFCIFEFVGVGGYWVDWARVSRVYWFWFKYWEGKDFVEKCLIWRFGDFFLEV